MQTSKKNQIRTEDLRLNRRTLGFLACGTAVLGISACGGGGGGGETSGAGSLRPAHEVLQPGMSRQDAINVVGSRPDSDIPETLTWRRYGELLRVSFVFRSRLDVFVIISSSWVAAAPSMEEDFRQLI